jgi:glycine cleavage system H protein
MALKRMLPLSKTLLNSVSRVGPQIIKSRNFFNIRTLNDRMRYTDTDEWLLPIDDTTHKVGLSNFASESLGELVYIEYNFEPGEHFKEGDEIVSVESVKASNGILAPFDGKLVSNNTELEENPQLVSDMPEDENTSWFCKIDKEFELI